MTVRDHFFAELRSDPTEKVLTLFLVGGQELILYPKRNVVFLTQSIKYMI
jgi:hypothetical protein